MKLTVTKTQDEVTVTSWSLGDTWTGLLTLFISAFDDLGPGDLGLPLVISPGDLARCAMISPGDLAR